MSDAETALPHEPAPSRRKFVVAFIAVFVSVQLLLPLRYYLQAQTPDERFAWRMFSSQGQRHCDAMLFDVVMRDGRLIEQQVYRGQYDNWMNSLREQRPSVVVKVLRWRCGQPDIAAAKLTLRCTDTDGRPLPPTHLWMDAKTLEVTEEAPAPR